jgi:hypothetical protein
MSYYRFVFTPALAPPTVDKLRGERVFTNGEKSCRAAGTREKFQVWQKRRGRKSEHPTRKWMDNIGINHQRES